MDSYECMSEHPLVAQLIANTGLNSSSGFIRYQPSGFLYPTVMKNYTDVIRNFQVRPDDIWISTFPKCGTTWTQELVWCLMNDLDFAKSKAQDLDDRMVFFEWVGLEVSGQMQDTFELAAKQPSPRIIKTHLPYSMLPDQITTGAVKPKIVYVTRNPRDVCVSFYHHYKILEGYTGSIELWTELFLEGMAGYYSPFFKHLESYLNLDAEIKENILYLNYEDMKQDLKSSIARTSQFLNKPINDTEKDQLAAHLSFKNFQNTPTLNKSRLVELVTSLENSNQEDGKAFVRKGVVGDWKNYFKDELVLKRFDEKEKELYEKTGYKVQTLLP